MVSSTSSPNQSSSFFNCKNHLKKQAQVPQITVLLFWLQELFKETGSTLDVHSMAGPSRTGLWITIFWIVQDRAWSCGLFLSQHSDHNNALDHPDTDALDAPQVENQDGYDLVLWQQISNFHQHCLPFISDGKLLSLDDVCLFFLWLDAFELLGILLQNHIWLGFFLSFGIFGCHCIAILFCMIIAVLKQLLCSIKFCWRR